MADPAFVHLLAYNFVGPTVIGAFLTCILYGILVTQCIAYWQGKRLADDPMAIRLMVVWMTLLQTFHVCAVMYEAYTHAVIGFGSVQYQLIPNVIGSIIIIDIGLAGATMQTFFGWRVYRMTRSLMLFAFILLLVLAQLVLNFYIGIWGSVLPSILDYGRFSKLVVAYQVISPVNDAIISITLVLVLRLRKTGLRETDSILNRISLFAIQTGLLTALWAIAGLILYMTHQANLISWILNWPLTVVYALCLIASLNARENWRRDSVIHFSDLASNTRHKGTHTTVVRTTRTEQDSDIHLDYLESATTKEAPSGQDLAMHFPSVTPVRDLSKSHPFDSESE